MGGPVDEMELIQSLKTDLMEALMEDPDFVLQHCHSLKILSNNQYNNIKDMNTRSKQVRDILDYVIHKDNKTALKFLMLLKRPDMQDTFPKLQFLQKLPVNKRKLQTSTETAAKRKRELLENEILHEQSHISSEAAANTLVPASLPNCCITSAFHNSADSRTVTEREMMRVARFIGNNWKEVGIMALDMNTTSLQQIEEDNKLHKERVFAMLRRWSMRERDAATVSRLYYLLTQEDNCVNPRNINFLLENS